jgi:hypothetical protein
MARAYAKMAGAYIKIDTKKSILKGTTIGQKLESIKKNNDTSG